jgi:hypothetical protein
VEVYDLPAFLPTVPPANVADPDGDTERALVARALLSDTIGAARLALTIVSPVRRAAWLQHFRPAPDSPPLTSLPAGRRPLAPVEQSALWGPL